MSEYVRYRTVQGDRNEVPAPDGTIHPKQVAHSTTSLPHITAGQVTEIEPSGRTDEPSGRNGQVEPSGRLGVRSSPGRRTDATSTVPDDIEDWRRGDPAEHVVESDPASVAAELRRRVALLGPRWHLAAACRGVDMRLFFPGRGQSSDEARAICARCPALTPCLNEALADVELDHGIRAGLGPIERRRLRAERLRGDQ